ncbi:hypothetical protein ACFX13_028726 [Malus domestica]
MISFHLQTITTNFLVGISCKIWSFAKGIEYLHQGCDQQIFHLAYNYNDAPASLVVWAFAGLGCHWVGGFYFWFGFLDGWPTRAGLACNDAREKRERRSRAMPERRGRVTPGRKIGGEKEG